MDRIAGHGRARLAEDAACKNPVKSGQAQPSTVCASVSTSWDKVLAHDVLARNASSSPAAEPSPRGDSPYTHAVGCCMGVS